DNTAPESGRSAVDTEHMGQRHGPSLENDKELDHRKSVKNGDRKVFIYETRISKVDDGPLGIIGKAASTGYTSRMNDPNKRHEIKMKIYKPFSDYRKNYEKKLTKRMYKAGPYDQNEVKFGKEAMENHRESADTDHADEIKNPENFCQVEIGKKKKGEFEFNDSPELDKEVIQNIGCPENGEILMSKVGDESMDAADMNNEIVDHLFDPGGKCLPKHPIQI
ncbi:17585_t:CDS:2, partial [Gigaspora margarita]